MKFHWGYKAALLYIGFVIFMLALVFRAVQEDFDLVTDDYYGEDIAYQSHIESVQNAKEMSVPVKLKYNGQNQSLELTFPEGMNAVEGNIHFYKPDKANLDFQVPLALNAHQQLVDFSSQTAGLWRVKLDWTHNGKGYFVENLFVKQ